MNMELTVDHRGHGWWMRISPFHAIELKEMDDAQLIATRDVMKRVLTHLAWSDIDFVTDLLDILEKHQRMITPDESN